MDRSVFQSNGENSQGEEDFISNTVYASGCNRLEIGKFLSCLYASDVKSYLRPNNGPHIFPRELIVFRGVLEFEHLLTVTLKHPPVLTSSTNSTVFQLTYTFSRLFLHASIAFHPLNLFIYDLCSENKSPIYCMLRTLILCVEMYNYKIYKRLWRFPRMNIM